MAVWLVSSLGKGPEIGEGSPERERRPGNVLVSSFCPIPPQSEEAREYCKVRDTDHPSRGLCSLTTWPSKREGMLWSMQGEERKPLVAPAHARGGIGHLLGSPFVSVALSGGVRGMKDHSSF